MKNYKDIMTEVLPGNIWLCDCCLEPTTYDNYHGGMLCGVCKAEFKKCRKCGDYYLSFELCNGKCHRC